MEVRAEELSQLFYEAAWMPSTESFADRPFVKWHGAWFSAAGYPPGQGCHSTVRRTDQEIIDWLNSFAVEPEPEPEVEHVVIHASDYNTVIEDLVEPITPDTPQAAELVNASTEGPGQYPEADTLADELERLKADNAAKDAELESLRQKLADETPQPLPPNPTEAKLSDYGEVGEPGVPGDLAQLMMDGEQLSEAVARLTPGIDELLDMASVLSDTSLARAVADFPEDRLEEWTEKLWAEKSILRTKRGTDEENLSRENLISRVAGLFMRVGAKR